MQVHCQSSTPTASLPPLMPGQEEPAQATDHVAGTQAIQRLYLTACWGMVNVADLSRGV